MKKLTLAGLLIVNVIACFAQRTIDVLHYQFALLLNDQNDTLSGRANITIKLLQHTNIVTLNLAGRNESGKGMQVDGVLSSKGDLPFTTRHNKLHITLDKSVQQGDTVRFSVFYRGIPADGLIISKNKYGNRTFFSDNWPNRAHHWIPCVDDPADKATVEFIVTAPSHYQVISNGLQVETTSLPNEKKLTHYREDVPIPTKVMVIGVAGFAVQSAGDVGCIPVSSWVFPENRPEGFHDYAPAKEILQWYIDYIGPYPYRKLANVQSKTIFGGMENANAIFYFENSVTGNREEEALIAHEIVHQWFGNHATEKSFAHLWLSEGFATYLTHVYLEARYGTDSLQKRMQEDREQVLHFVNSARKPVVDSVSEYMQLLNANSYQKGSWILHMLRRELGDSIFHKAVRLYYSTYAGKNADSYDLQKVFESVAGKKLDTFFRQWLHLPAHPKLEMTWEYRPGEKKIILTAKQQQPEGPFVFPLELQITNAAQQQFVKKIRITRQTEIFSLPAEGVPVSLKADPSTSLLFEATVKKLVP